MAKPRVSGFQPCATLSCSGRTPTRVGAGRGRGTIFCEACSAMRDTPLNPPIQLGERDIERITTQEAKQGGGPHTNRLTLHGPGECVVCSGPTLRGRLYCSRRCRSAGRRGEGAIVIDSVEATVAQHAKRIGMGLSTLVMRLRMGASVREALDRPIDETRRRCG